jgi:hypothetical protein
MFDAQLHMALGRFYGSRFRGDLSRLLAIKRQFDAECAPDAFMAVHRDPPPVRLYRMTDASKPHPSPEYSVPNVRGPIEAVEDVRQVDRRDAQTMITDR